MRAHASSCRAPFCHQIRSKGSRLLRTAPLKATAPRLRGPSSDSDEPKRVNHRFKNRVKMLKSEFDLSCHRLRPLASVGGVGAPLSSPIEQTGPRTMAK